MSEQLPLGLKLRASAVFENFIAASQHELLIQLQQLAVSETPAQLYCWGRKGSGKTHLLQATCRHADSRGRSAVYLPLAQADELHPGILEGLDSYRLVCLDDIDRIAGEPAWEEALFHLYNQVVAAGGHWLCSAACIPSGLNIGLPDLLSRLGAGPVYQLHALNDAQSLEAMRLRARQFGFDLPEETGRYLLRHVPRDLPALMQLLEKLDTASLAAQRRLTIPFVKSVLGL